MRQPSPTAPNWFPATTPLLRPSRFKLLPTSLGEAVNLAENSELLLQTLGDHTLTSLIRNKQLEWEEYRATVSDYEISRYLPLL